MPDDQQPPAPKAKANYVGAPAIFALEVACSTVMRAFPDSFGIYLVGSATERPDWRDVDLRMIMSDEEFQRLFPDVASLDYATWEHDARWLLLTISISRWLSQESGLPIDFQFQPQTFANSRHDKPRHAMGLRYASPRAPSSRGDSRAFDARDIGFTLVSSPDEIAQLKRAREQEIEGLLQNRRVLLLD